MLGGGFLGVTTLGYIMSLFDDKNSERSGRSGTGYVMGGGTPSADDRNEQLNNSLLDACCQWIDQGQKSQAENALTSFIRSFEEQGSPIEEYYKFISLLGDLYEKQGQLEKAEQTFAKGVKGFEKSLSPQNRMGNSIYAQFLKKQLEVLMNLKKYDQAAKLCETLGNLKSLSHDPTLSQLVLLNLGRINLYQGNVEQSRHFFDSLVANLDIRKTAGFAPGLFFQQQQQKLAEILSQVATLNYKEGWLEQAEHWLKLLIDRFPSTTTPSHVEVRNQLANLHWQNGNNRDAEDIYRTIVASPDVEKLSFLGTTSRYFTTAEAGFNWNLQERLASFYIKLSIRDLDVNNQVMADPNFKPLSPGFVLHIYFENPVDIDDQENKQENKENKEKPHESQQTEETEKSQESRTNERTDKPQGIANGSEQKPQDRHSNNTEKLQDIQKHQQKLENGDNQEENSPRPNVELLQQDTTQDVEIKETETKQKQGHEVSIDQNENKETSLDQQLERFGQEKLFNDVDKSNDGEAHKSRYIKVSQVLSADALRKRHISIRSPSFAKLRKRAYHVRVVVFSPKATSEESDLQLSSHNELIVSKFNTTCLTTPELRQLFPSKSGEFHNH